MNCSISKQLAELAQTLDREEKTGILRYLCSPYHNRRTELFDLMRLILDSRSSMATLEEQRKQLFATAAEGKATKWRLLNSDLLKLLEHFLADRHPRLKSSIGQQLDLYHLLGIRGLPLRQAAAERRLEREMESLPTGVTKSRIDYEVNWEKLTEKLTARKLTVGAANQVRRLHERSCILEALQLACESASTRTIDGDEPEAGLLPLYLQYLENSKLLANDRVVALYYYCYQTVDKLEGESAFEELRDRLSDLGLLDDREATDILRIAINACIRRVNDNRPKFGLVALDLYDLGLENGYLLNDRGDLSRFTYSNIVALALKADNPERARLVIERFSEKLAPAYAQSTEALNRARLNFHENKLEAAMEWIQAAKDQDLLTTLNIRILQMRVFYQLGELRLLDAHLDALRTFLRRRKDSLDYHYKAYNNLIKLVARFRRSNPYDREEMEKFRQQVLTTERLPEKSWLLRISKG
jgi:hypothetical protein